MQPLRTILGDQPKTHISQSVVILLWLTQNNFDLYLGFYFNRWHTVWKIGCMHRSIGICYFYFWLVFNLKDKKNFRCFQSSYHAIGFFEVVQLKYGSSIFSYLFKFATKKALLRVMRKVINSLNFSICCCIKKLSFLYFLISIRSNFWLSASALRKRGS